MAVVEIITQGVKVNGPARETTSGGAEYTTLDVMEVHASGLATLKSMFHTDGRMLADTLEGLEQLRKNQGRKVSRKQ